MGFGPGFSFSWRTFRSLDPRRFDKGSADLFLDKYCVFGSGGHWDSRKSCKYEGGELNSSRKIVVITFFVFQWYLRRANYSIKIVEPLAGGTNYLIKITPPDFGHGALDRSCYVLLLFFNFANLFFHFGNPRTCRTPNLNLQNNNFVCWALSASAHIQIKKWQNNNFIFWEHSQGSFSFE